MDEELIQLKLEINRKPEDDESNIAKITRQLRKELKSIDIEDVDYIKKGDVPENAKAFGAEVWGELLVSLVASGGVASGLIGLLQTRIKRDGHTIKITKQKKNGTMEHIELTGSSGDEQKQFIEWITRDN